MHNYKIYNFEYITKILFIVIVYELIIGGSGHFTVLFGSFTLRMFLYFNALLFSLIYYSINKTIKKNVLIIILSLTIVSLLGILIGILNDAKYENYIEDFKPLSFIYIILFFSIVIKRIEDIEKISSTIKKGSIILAIGYTIVLFLLYKGIINFDLFYAKQNEIGEIMFRNDFFFFYKGFLYLCIGFIFYLFSKSKFKIIPILFLFSCIILTLTRGFILFTTVVFIIYLLFINKNIYLKFLFIVLIIFILVKLLPTILNYLGDKSESDTIRYTQIEQVISSIDPISLIIGHGFGIGVPIRKIHMELSFLEIFHKQGILGLIFWFGLFLHVIIMYIKIKIKKYKEIALPFLLSVIFVILQSTTNPYINNPIGLTIILLTIVVFSKLNELQKINQ